MRRFNKKLPWFKCEGRKPIAAAFTNHNNIEVYNISDTHVELATPDGKTRSYTIQEDDYGFKYIIYKGCEIRLSRFISIGEN